MASLHVFNPEHDLALAYGREGFTPPAAACHLRSGLGFLPAFWSADGDLVLVDDALLARREASRWEEWLPDVTFVEADRLAERLADAAIPLDVDPWGWDASLRHRLLSAGVPESWLPTSAALDSVRRLSHRSATIPMLGKLVASVPQTVGLRQEVHSMDAVRLWMKEHGPTVLKSPWSSSGRGVRFADDALSPNLEGFVRNVLQRQGGVIVEPWYHRVADFAMEYWSDGDGIVRLLGLSLFTTVNGAYTGNVLASEDEKWAMLGRLVDIGVARALPLAVADGLSLMCADYQGPLGVDMMVVDCAGTRMVHPCVEVNVRRTMGMAAIDVARCTRGRFQTMTVDVAGTVCHMRLTEKEDCG